MTRSDKKLRNFFMKKVRRRVRAIRQNYQCYQDLMLEEIENDPQICEINKRMIEEFGIAFGWPASTVKVEVQYLRSSNFEPIQWDIDEEALEQERKRKAERKKLLKRLKDQKLIGPGQRKPSIELKVETNDQKFLRGLRISLGEEDDPTKDQKDSKNS